VAEQRRGRSLAPRYVQDLVAVLLIILGISFLILAAWLWHPLLGLAVVGASTIAVGVVLGLDR
jgi:uncharacterized membrane protein